jgi:50S ribosomal protein L16 3-hydroxylase
MSSGILGGLTAARFLTRHWQKRPLLVRGAFPGFRDPLTPEDLARLSCVPDVESRLVLRRGGSRPWQVVEGPQDPRRLRRLPASHWTLLVQDVNLHVPALADLLDRFDFVPHWRVDDVMVSFAARNGSVGPHLDSYDVFLLQGRGRRRWQLDPRAQPDWRPGLDLRILRRFTPAREWVLAPGDMLYLPPGVAHYGVALEDCLTYSIGFRAPSQRDLVVAWAERLVESASEARRYVDPDLRLGERGAIPSAALARLRELVAQVQDGVTTRDLEGLLGETLTRRKGGTPRRQRSGGPLAVARAVRSGRGLTRDAGARLAFIRRGGAVDLFVDGRLRPLGSRLAFAAALLSGSRRVPAAVLRPHLRRPGFAALLVELIEAGVFRLR